jgi:hypothetical protein
VILYALVCKAGHAFESWFANSSAYDKQLKRSLVTCPVCGSPQVEKAIMAPSLGRNSKAARAYEAAEVISAPEAAAEPAANAATANAATANAATAASKAPVAMLSEQERELRSKLKELRDHLVKNADYVGQKFPEEARRMHYGEIEHRSIYGEASPDDAKELHEEGIEFHPLPHLPDERN